MTDDTDGAQAETVEDEPLLARVPEWVVHLGAGSLATSTLLTAAGAIFVGYAIATGQHFGFQSFELYVAAFQFVLVTVAQAAGVYFARRQVRWTWVMLAAILGSLAVITLPFTVLALLCTALGKYHFASYTPADRISGA